MSFIADTLLSAGARLHIGGGGKHGSSQSQAGRLDPLFRLVKDPFDIFGSGRNDTEKQKAKDEEHRKQVLYLRLQEAESYDDWKAAATELDILEGNDAWKREDKSSEFDAELIRTRIEQFDEARLSCDVPHMLDLVRKNLTRDLGGMGDLRMYKHSHIGTKKLIERYIDSAVQLLAAIPEVVAKQGDKCPISPFQVAEKLLRTRQSFGRTALLLSGGGTFGMNHIGVVKCLWELRLLPRIISGASAGSIVCAVLCSKIDEEIPAVLSEFCYGDLDVFGKEEGLMQKITRFLKHGTLFDIEHLARVMRDMLGDITFYESYNRTRRILNITVSGAGAYEVPRLLNYITAPHVMIWSAVCASCSVPLVFSEAHLMVRDSQTGEPVKWNPNLEKGWIDGSVDNDLPMTRMAELYNVNHFIVSQVNPHVVPFLTKEEDAISAEAQQNSAAPAGAGLSQDSISFAKSEILHRLDVLAEMGLFPNIMTKVSSILNQRYSGDITIFPQISYANFPKILSNPTTDFMQHALLAGERATWLKVSRIQNHVAVELALDESINKVNSLVHFSPQQVNLRLLHLKEAGLPPNHPLLRHKRARHSENGLPLAPFTPSIEPSPPDKTSSKATSKPAPKPYLPNHSPINSVHPPLSSLAFSPLDPISSTEAEHSSTDADVSDNTSSDTSAFSPFSPAHSPPASAPTLYPRSPQNQFPFPAVSTPATPSAPAALFNNKRGADFGDGPMSSAAPAEPSTPELRYKRLFHPPQPQGEPTQLQPFQQEVRRLLQPLTGIAPRECAEGKEVAGDEGLGLGLGLGLSGVVAMRSKSEGG